MRFLLLLIALILAVHAGYMLICDLIEFPRQVREIKQRAVIDAALDDPTTKEQIDEIINQYAIDNDLSPQSLKDCIISGDMPKDILDQIIVVLRAYASQNAPSFFKNAI